jgi:polysaccharide deacetylase family protein (PEP-CTERM system associated)
MDSRCDSTERPRPPDAKGHGSTQSTPNAFSVDVEDYFQVAALSKAISRDSWPTRDSRVERNTEIILQILEERGVRGTFFVLGWVAERSPQLVRRIAAAGHEIACHGYSHQLIYLQTPSEFEGETRRAKHHLEDVIGGRVLGYRAASFSITPRSLWALDTLLDLGFEWPSSWGCRYRFPAAAIFGFSPTGSLEQGSDRSTRGGSGLLRSICIRGRWILRSHV